MEKKCAKCGKKLGILNKVPIKGGYLCKECAKEYKDSITNEKLKFKELSIEALEEKHTQANQKNYIMIGILILIVVVGIAFLAISGSGKKADMDVSDKVTQNEVAEEVDNTDGSKKNEDVDEIISEKDKTRKYECGDTAHFDNYDITVKNPTKGVMLKTNVGITDYSHGMKIPIIIKCKKDTTIGRGNFDSIAVLEPEENELPDKLEMKAGDTFKGYFYTGWGGNSITFDDVESWFSDADDIEKSTWSFNYKTKTKECKSTDDLYKLLPGDKVKATVYFYNIEGENEEERLGYDNLVGVSFNDDATDGLLLSTTNKAFKVFKKCTYASLEQFRIKGKLVQLTRQSDEGVYTLEVLDNVSIIE